MNFAAAEKDGWKLGVMPAFSSFLKKCYSKCVLRAQMASFNHPLVLAPEECAANALPINGPALRDILDDNPDGVDLVNIGWPSSAGPSSGANTLSSSSAPIPLQVPIPGGSGARTPSPGVDQMRSYSPTVEFPQQHPIPLPGSPGIRRSPTVSPQRSPMVSPQQSSLPLPSIVTEPIPTLALSGSLSTAAEDSQVRKRGREEPEGSQADRADDNPEQTRAESETGNVDDQRPPKVAKRAKSTRKKSRPSSLLVTRSTRPSKSLSTPRPAGIPLLSMSSVPAVSNSAWTHLYPLATSSAPGASLDPPHDSPKWLSRAVQLFDINLGPKWIRAVGLWYTIEESFGFADRRRFPDKEKHRPDAIAQWQKNDRSTSWRPGRVQFESYGHDFWAWWLAIQPTRRANGGTDRSIRDVTVFDKSVFDFYGALGMLQVIAALFFWGNAIVEDRKVGGRAGEDGSWAEALDDVVWVMERLHADRIE